MRALFQAVPGRVLTTWSLAATGNTYHLYLILQELKRPKLPKYTWFSKNLDIVLLAWPSLQLSTASELPTLLDPPLFKSLFVKAIIYFTHNA